MVVLLYREIMVVCSESHTKYRNPTCVQNITSVNVKPGDV